MSDRFSRELEFAAELAREAGAVTLRHFDRGVEPTWKADRSPVTVADLEAEDLIRSRLAAAFPEDGVLGEEREEKPGRSGRRWVIDPIDGTKSFVQGVPLYAVLVALEVEGVARVGAVYLPALDELVCAAAGSGCTRNGEACRVSPVDRLEDACVVYTSQRSFAEAGDRGLRARERLAERARLLRGWGDAYGYILVATGRAEAMFDPVINPWDIACMKPILEEAGGTLTDWDGAPSIHSGHSFATNGKLFDALLECLE